MHYDIYQLKVLPYLPVVHCLVQPLAYLFVQHFGSYSDAFQYAFYCKYILSWHDILLAVLVYVLQLLDLQVLT